MCECIELANRKLAEHNTKVEAIWTLPALGLTCGIRTVKLDAKKRGSPRTLMASFCPFCGRKYKQSAPGKL